MTMSNGLGGLFGAFNSPAESVMKAERLDSDLEEWMEMLDKRFEVY